MAASALTASADFAVSQHSALAADGLIIMVRASATKGFIAPKVNGLPLSQLALATSGRRPMNFSRYRFLWCESMLG